MVTIEDVAKAASVSTMTVSRVINNSPLVKEETAQKVKRVIEELGYRPNRLASSLVSGKSKTIGVIYSNMYNQVYTDVINGIEEIAYDNDYVVISINVDSLYMAKKTLNMLIGSQIDGCILLPLEMNMSKSKEYDSAVNEIREFCDYFRETVTSYNIPVTTVFQKIGGIVNVNFDYVNQARMAMDYLLGKGFENIAMLNSNIYEGFWRDKENVYREAMKRAGLEDHICVERDVCIVEGGYEAMKRLLKQRVPEAVYCSNDYFAIGAIQAINEAGIKIPNDISVMGNDNIYFCEMVFPKLTTVSLNPNKVGKKAMEILLKLLSKGNINKDIIVPPTLVERNSIK